jgi:hypothetical protein
VLADGQEEGDDEVREVWAPAAEEKAPVVAKLGELGERLQEREEVRAAPWRLP